MTPGSSAGALPGHAAAVRQELNAFLSHLAVKERELNSGVRPTWRDRHLDEPLLTAVMLSMTIAQSKLTAQGQISVPAAVRKKLGIGPGSTLEWQEEGDKIVVRRIGRFTSTDLHAALFSSPPKPRSLAELKDGLRTHAKRRHARR